jgi:hypothetical protein
MDRFRRAKKHRGIADTKTSDAPGRGGMSVRSVARHGIWISIRRKNRDKRDA